MNKIFLFPLALAMTFLTAQARADLSCVQAVQAVQSVHAKTSAFISDDGVKNIDPLKHSLRNREDCQKDLAALKNNYICYWNGSNYQPFETKKKKFVGDEGRGYDKLGHCLDSVAKSAPNSVCTWNGSNFQPYSLSGAYGTESYGYDKLAECQSVTQSSNHGLTCMWNGTDTAIYRAGEADEAYGVFHFKKTESCNTFIKKIAIDAEIAPPLDTSASLSRLLVSLKDKADAKLGFTLKNCVEAKRHRSLTKTDAQGNILPECVPDTLYSWGSDDRLEWFQANMGEKRPWLSLFKRPVFFTESPSSTFGYGAVPLRIKLKDGVKAKFVNSPKVDSAYSLCEKLLKPEQMQNTILIRYFAHDDGSGLDYILCSSGPIASWSYGQAEHYDEVVNDVSWILKHDQKDYALYYRSENTPNMFDTSLDNHDFSQEALRNNLVQFKEMMLLKIGGLYYNEGIEANRDEHFKTKKPIYYNPN